MKYKLVNTQTGEVIGKSTLSRKEAQTLNYAFNSNAVNKQYILETAKMNWPNDFDGAHHVNKE